MSDYLLSRVKLGDVVNFRYDAPSKKPRSFFEPPRVVMILTPNYNGHLHGIKLTGLNPAEQEYIQMVLMAAYSNPQNIFEPLEAQIQIRKKEIDTLNSMRNEMIRQGQKVVVKPAPPDINMMDKAKRVLGSVVGKISTFGRTNAQTQPAPDRQAIQQQIQKNNQMVATKKAELDLLISNLNKTKAQLQSIPSVPTDPYSFYHMFFKSFIGNNARMKQIYRKYNVAYIKTPRVVKSVGIIPYARK